ncbi:MAG: flavodoxin family protein [Candidatus Omnitrophica bacterium]|nr:flavodoxin family protein [Candidatus Omnitrophota bacterium]
MKRVLMVCGSPRQPSSTNAVAEWVREGAVAAGAKVQAINTARLQYKSNGCTACMGCQRAKEFVCVIADDAAPLLASIPEYDVLVFVTPLYFFGPSAQLKIFWDRMYSLFKYDAATGTIIHRLRHMTFGLVATGGGAGFAPLEDTVKAFADFCGCRWEKLVVPYVEYQKGVQGNRELQQKAVSFGRQLVAAQQP